MSVIPDEDLFKCTTNPKQLYETQALYEISKLGYTVIKMEWKPTGYCNGTGLYVTFGKLKL